MGEHDGWGQPTGLSPNGLLPNAGPLIQVLDSERWLKAEERTADLIAHIQPNQPSEERRNAVAYYVQRLIMKCFPCQVFTFGSVPLKTYLPDGDIDLTAFSNNQTLKDTWANQVRDMLESEEKNENAEFHVKEVQYIQAEVKIIKCLVENIVVDISFNQLGGLCTLCFLEEVDNLINQNHLFKRSIILIKAWCYYESRILGAHHGLISTYALETLVLYIFHVFNNSFAGPLEVLYRFLEFFSNFDWENFCVSLWGPVPISSLPDVTAKPPRKDSGDLLLSKLFLDACSSVYAVFPAGLENQGQSFTSKHFNVIDPLRVSNNLGRSVSKGNFFRIRSAFTFGAKRLARLLDCPKENLLYEVNQFFMNTWDRHGSGNRPDAPKTDLCPLRSNTQIQIPEPENLKNVPYVLETESEVSNSHNSFSQRESISRVAGQFVREAKHSHNTNNGQRNLKSDHVANDIKGRFLFARTHSSPELTDNNIYPHGRRGGSKAPESGKVQDTFVRPDSSNRRKNQSGRSSTDDHQSLESAAELSNGLDGYHHELGEELLSPAASTQGMIHQEEQDLVNMMSSSSTVHGFNGQVSVPLNLPLPFSSSMLTSMGYGHRNLVPTNFPMIDPSFANMQFPQGIVSPHYFSGYGVPSNSEDAENCGSTEMNSREADQDFWRDHDLGSVEGFDPDTDNFERQHVHRSDDRPRSTSSSSSRVRVQQKYVRGKRGIIGDVHEDDFQSDERTASSRYSSATHNSSLRGKSSSESSWDGSLGKVSKSPKEKRGKKPVLEEHDQDWNSQPNSGTEVVERNLGPQSLSSIQVPGYEPAQTSGSDSMLPITPVILGHGNRQRMMDNSGLFAFYPTGPPVPFLTMLPLYNIPQESGISDLGTETSDSGQNFDESEDLNLSTNNSVSDEQHKSDILHSDFASHWQNLLYGRFCQNPRHHGGPMVYPSPVMVPPVYLQGHFPWDGPGRPVSANMNLVTQLMSYGPRLVPVAPFQSAAASNRPPNVFQRHFDDIPRYRSGTGTYLPNPKVAFRDRHSSSGTRRGNYNYDRSDSHNEREGNWNMSSKSRATGGRKSSPRLDRLAGSESRADRSSSWNSSYRHDSIPSSYQSQNGPIPSQGGDSPNMAYGMYTAVDSSGTSSSNRPSVVMLYPFDHGANYGSQPDQLEFGSLGPVGFSGVNEQPQTSEGGGNGGGGGGGSGRTRRAFDEHRFHGGSVHRSLPDQPSSPHHESRRI